MGVGSIDPVRDEALDLWLDVELQAPIREMIDQQIRARL
jgi:hypothetical protein